jgi:hypothetical protein
LRSQQVLVAQTSPAPQSASVLQSARGAQGTSGPQKPRLLASSKQKQLPSHELRLPQDEPSQVGAAQSPLLQMPEGQTVPQAPQLLGSLRTSWHGPPLQLSVPGGQTGGVGMLLTVVGVAPTHEQALEYRTLPEQAEAYVGMAVGVTVTVLPLTTVIVSTK